MDFRIRKEGVTLSDIIKLEPCKNGLHDFMLWLVSRGTQLDPNEPIGKDLLVEAFDHNSTWFDWAKDEKIVDVSHDKLEIGHVYKATKSWEKDKTKSVRHYYVFEEPDCDWTYLIDLGNDLDTIQVESHEIFSDSDDCYSQDMLLEESGIKMLKDLGPLKNHLKVSAFK